MLHAIQPTLKIQRQKALFDERLTREVLPRTEIVFIWGNRSAWHSVYGMILIEREYKEYIEQGYRIRPIRFIEIEGANRFVNLSVFASHYY
jgi:hypothetical protein